jgi:acyl-CoA reductase-like NAD-dependent aldehyde dehydrogenase
METVVELMQALGAQAKAASALMAKANTATKNAALRRLSALLRANVPALQAENAKDMARATAAGLAAPLVDRLKLSAATIETVAQGCDQLAAMPDVIGEIIGMKQQPSGIRVGQMRVPIGVFGMISRAGPMSRLKPPACPSRAATPASCAAARKPSSPTRPWPGWCSRPWWRVACPRRPCNWCPPSTVKPWAS